MNKTYFLAALLMATLVASCTPGGGTVGISTPAAQPIIVTATYGIAGQSVLIAASEQAMAQTKAVNEAQIAEASQRAAVATAEWQATYSALSVAQTQAAMQAESDSRTATARSQSDNATATAQAAGTATARSENTTATAQSFAVIKMEQDIAARGTELAIKSHSLATQEAADAEGAIAWNNTQKTLAGVAMLGGVAAIAGALLIWLYFWTIRHDANTQQHIKLLAEAASRDHYETEKAQAAMWKETTVERDGKPYRITSDGMQLLIIESPEEAIASRAATFHLRIACKKFIKAAVMLARGGEERPFSERSMTIRSSIVTRPDTGEAWVEGYRLLVRILSSKDVGVLSAKQGKTTTWAKGWTLERFEREFDMLPLPAVDEADIPDINITLRSSAVAAVSRSSAVPQSTEDQEDTDL